MAEKQQFVTINLPDMIDDDGKAIALPEELRSVTIQTDIPHADILLQELLNGLHLHTMSEIDKTLDEPLGGEDSLEHIRTLHNETVAGYVDEREGIAHIVMEQFSEMMAHEQGYSAALKEFRADIEKLELGYDYKTLQPETIDKDDLNEGLESEPESQSLSL